MGSADAGTLHAVTICSRAAATAVDSKDSASLVTEHLMRKRSGSATTVRAEFDGSSTKVVNHRFTVVPPCYI